MATWEICYETGGVRYNELVDDPCYGERLSRRQLQELAEGLRGESDDTISILWVRPMAGHDHAANGGERIWPLRASTG